MLPHRKSIRLRDHDYSKPGFYFITICISQMQSILGKIVDQQTVLSPFGKIVTRCWNAIPTNFPDAEIDAFVVMPNHIHGIIHHRESSSVQLHTIVQNFKSVSTRRINQLQRTAGISVWQRNYYEHIIRSERSLNFIRLYIQLNPGMWEQDARMADLNDLTEERIEEILFKFRSKNL